MSTQPRMQGQVFKTAPVGVALSRENALTGPAIETRNFVI
jgi:hypothetical protein